MSLLGNILKTVLGREEIQVYIKKAEAGDPQAQFTLGIQYERGQCGLPQDYLQSAKWYRKAAEQGHAEAQLYLGAYLAQGKGVEQNLIEAFKWIDLARKGNAFDRVAAQDTLNRLVQLMTAEQMADGMALSFAFVPKKESQGETIKTMQERIHELEDQLDHSLSKPHDLTKIMRAFKIVQVEDESEIRVIIHSVIYHNFKNVVFNSFDNGDEAWEALLRDDPDLLIITDLMNNNVPGRKGSGGKSGYELLYLLAHRKVKYPILVFAGNLTNEGLESKARQITGSDLNITFLQKPLNKPMLYSAIETEIYTELFKHVKPIPVFLNLLTEATSAPNHLAFQARNGTGESHRLTHRGAGILEYRYADKDNRWGDPLYLNPKSVLWEQFWRDLDSIDVWQWNQTHQTPGILDRGCWRLELDYGGHSLRSVGTNADGVDAFCYSDPFELFITALENLAGFQALRYSL